ncbi:MAG: FHA domain-containing protein [Planctomycetota bacterium]
MAFYLTVIGGVDDGKVFEIDGPSALVGRSGSADVKLNDESVSWEHAKLTEEDGRFTVENLSALGTKVKGLKIPKPTKIAPGDEIELSQRCKVRLDVRAVAAAESSSNTTLLLAGLLIVVLLVAGFGVLTTSGPAQAYEAPMTSTHWRNAYTTLSENIDEWSAGGVLPPDTPSFFRDAWLDDLSGNTEEAGRKWDQFAHLLRTTPAPTGDDPRLENQTFASVAGKNWSTDQKPILRQISGRDPGDLSTSGPVARIKALWGFVTYRQWQAKQGQGEE